LYIDSKTRSPKVKGVKGFQNNVVYNWGLAGASFANVVGNYFVTGPSACVAAFTRGNANFRAYVR
ncbi:hypothetical protein LX36DRAFT_556528, partial [Colletotrichum falcatum]